MCPQLKGWRSVMTCLIAFCCVTVVLNVVWFSRVGLDDGDRLSTEKKRPPPEVILYRLQPLVQRSRIDFNATANRIVVRGVAYHTFAQRLKETPHHEALSIREALETYTLLRCRLDQEMLEGDQPDGAVYVTTVMKNAEEKMPNFVVQIIRLALFLKPGQLFVSVYESGSEDATPQWLLIVRELLNMIRCPNQIVIHGEMHREAQESRSQFLARLRNAAMHPLKRWKKGRLGKIVLLDDVFFCAQHILRLYKTESDIACGMDFTEAMPKWSWLSSARKGAGADLVPTFRDVWSSIDVMGHHFSAYPPFVKDVYGRELLYKGTPFPVHSCANGIMALRMAPFFQNITFRGSPIGKCPAAESVLLCEDFARHGFGHIAIDPSVRVTHGKRTAAHIYAQLRNGGFAFVPYTDVAHNIRYPSQPKRVECCSRPENGVKKFDFCLRKTVL